MTLFDKLSKAAKNAAAGASTLAKNAADSTEEMIAVQKLKMKINEEEKAIVEVKTFIGELTWQQFDGQGDKTAQIEEQCQLIQESRSTIAQLEQQISDLKAQKEAIRSERKAAAAAAAASASAAGEVSDAVEDVVEDVKEAAEKVSDKVEDVVEEAKQTVRDAVADIKEDIPAAQAEVVEEAAPAADGHCPSCGAQVSAGARFCGVCGAQQDR